VTNIEQYKRDIGCLMKKCPECNEILSLCLELLEENYYRSRRMKDGLKNEQKKH
jgi:hypothetical protein